MIVKQDFVARFYYTWQNKSLKEEDYYKDSRYIYIYIYIYMYATSTYQTSRDLHEGTETSMMVHQRDSSACEAPATEIKRQRGAKVGVFGFEILT